MPAPKRATNTSGHTCVRQMTICQKGFAREHQRYVFFLIIHLSGPDRYRDSFKPGQGINILTAAW